MRAPIGPDRRSSGRRLLRQNRPSRALRSQHAGPHCPTRTPGDPRCRGMGGRPGLPHAATVARHPHRWATLIHRLRSLSTAPVDNITPGEWGAGLSSARPPTLTTLRLELSRPSNHQAERRPRPPPHPMAGLHTRPSWPPHALGALHGRTQRTSEGTTPDGAPHPGRVSHLLGTRSPPRRRAAPRRITPAELHRNDSVRLRGDDLVRDRSGGRRDPDDEPRRRRAPAEADALHEFPQGDGPRDLSPWRAR